MSYTRNPVPPLNCVCNHFYRHFSQFHSHGRTNRTSTTSICLDPLQKSSHSNDRSRLTDNDNRFVWRNSIAEDYLRSLSIVANMCVKQSISNPSTLVQQHTSFYVDDWRRLLFKRGGFLLRKWMIVGKSYSRPVHGIEWNACERDGMHD